MLVRYNPVRNQLGLRSALDRWFDDVLSAGNQWPENSLQVVPAVDLQENEDEYRFSAEIPGMKKDDIHISIENQILSISGEKKSENEVNKENYHRVERSYGKFHRSFELPAAVDQKKIEARYEDGVLNIVIPKAEEAKPKKIDVKVK